MISTPFLVLAVLVGIANSIAVWARTRRTPLFPHINDGAIEAYQLTEKGAIEHFKKENIQRGIPDGQWNSYKSCKKKSDKLKYGNNQQPYNCMRMPNHVGLCAGLFMDGRHYTFNDGVIK